MSQIMEKGGQPVATPNGPNDKPTRLMITKMVLENFKSYAGVQEIGPFHKRFSSIVGPNGSGKSNVIDALLFVFGKRAKQLRLNKVSELIHKSSGFINLEYARVAIHFQLIYDDEESADDFEIVPGSEFVVSRVAYQNNQSKYTVDGKTSTYTEVGVLLRSFGIDLDNNRFLILQGEVEQIAMMKPKGATPHEEGLLEYLEDIIGSNRHLEQIEEVTKSLDEINDQRVEKVNRLKIAERERENLSGSKSEAESFMEKDRDVRRKSNVLYQIYLKRASQNVQDFSDRYDKAKTKLDYERGKIKDSETRLTDMERSYEMARQEYNNVDSTLQKASLEMSAYERRDVKIQEDMKHQKAQLAKSQAAFAKEAKKESECLEEADKALGQIDALKKSLDDLNVKKAEDEAKIEEIMSGLQEATSAMRAQLEVAQGRLATAERSISSLVTDKESVETSIKLTQARAASASNQLSGMEAKLNKLQEDRKAGASKVQALDSERLALDQEIQSLEMKIQSLTTEEATIQASVRQAMSSCEEAKAAMAAEKGSSGVNSVVANVLKLAKKGGPLANVGVRGRLGDLASIHPDFDVAVSTACSFLDYIVVDTTEGAQACMSFMREHNIGRASFIVLDQMNEWRSRMSKSFDTPGGTNRLFDLIQLPATSADVRPAFYMALKDTLVTEDLDVAVKIAYVGDKARFRVVTKGGSLIDASGTMSGGGNAKKSGCMRLSTSSSTTSTSSSSATVAATAVAKADGSESSEITPALLKSLENKVEELQRSLAQCRSERSASESRIKECKQRIKSITIESEKNKLALASFEEQHKELSSRLVAQRAECQLSADESAELSRQEAQLASINAEISRVSPDIQSQRIAVSNIQRQILDVGGAKLARAQSRVDLLNGQINKISSSLSTLEVDEANNRKQSVKSAQTKSKLEADLIKVQEKLASLVAEQKEMEEEAYALMEALEAAKGLMEEKEKYLKSIEKDFNELKIAVSKIKSVEIDLLEEVEKINKDIASGKADASTWTKKLEDVRQLHIDEQTEFNAAVSLAVAATIAANSSSSNSTGTASASSSSSSSSASESTASIEVLPQLRPEQLDLAEKDCEQIKREINLLEAEKEKMKSSVNLNALLEYMRKDAAYKSRLVDLEEITERRNQIRKVFEDLRRARLEEFMAGFGVITLKLKEMYQMITLGGDAELELVDSLDPFSEGIVFSVRPPKKSWKNISNLSGGEKTLSSLALVFALHHFKPTPLYVMDEIDAALDFKNVSIVANYIKERTKNAQFVIISLRNNMFELADRLVGIYKTHDATKSVTINPKMFEQAQVATKNQLAEERELSSSSSAAIDAAAGQAPTFEQFTKTKRVLADSTNRRA